MSQLAYRFVFDPTVSLAEAEMTLHLAVVAVEGLHGAARVRMDIGYRLKAAERAIFVDASTTAGGSLAEVFTALALREFGDNAVSVRRMTVPSPRSTSSPTTKKGRVNR